MNEIKQLAQTIKDTGGDLYFVGGYVRDMLLHRQLHDIDLLVTGLTENQVHSVLKDSQIKYTICGKSFGVFKFKLGDHDIDLALPRKERSIGVGHTDFKIDSGPHISLEEDLGRRDFTINALAQNVLTGKVLDHHGGLKDLAKGYLHSVSKTSLQEDFLRALRACQFAARLGFHISKPTFKQMVDHRNLLGTISDERIRMELVKLVQAPNVVQGFNYLKFSELLADILPELAANDTPEYNFMFHRHNTYMHTLISLEKYNRNQRADLEVSLAILLHDIGKQKTLSQDEFGVYHNINHASISAYLAKKWMLRFRFDNTTIDNVTTLIRNHMFDWAHATPKTVRKLMSDIGYYLSCKLLQVIYYDSQSCIEPIAPDRLNSIVQVMINIHTSDTALKVTDLKVNGHDMMELGLEGKAIGDTLNHLLDLVIDDPDSNDYDVLINYVRERIKHDS